MSCDEFEAARQCCTRGELEGGILGVYKEENHGLVQFNCWDSFPFSLLVLVITFKSCVEEVEEKEEEQGGFWLI